MGKLPSCVFCPVEFFNATLLFRFPSATSGPCSVSRLEPCLAPEPGTGPRVSLILDLGPWLCSLQQPGRPRAASSSLASQTPARGPPGVVTAPSHPAAGPPQSPRRGTVTSRRLPCHLPRVCTAPSGGHGLSCPAGLLAPRHLWAWARGRSLSFRDHPILSRDTSILSCGSGGDSTSLGPMDLDKPTRALCICNY